MQRIAVNAEPETTIFVRLADIGIDAFFFFAAPSNEVYGAQLWRNYIE